MGKGPAWGRWEDECPCVPGVPCLAEAGEREEKVSGKLDCPGLWCSARREMNIYVKLRVQEKPTQADLCLEVERVPLQGPTEGDPRPIFSV